MAGDITQIVDSISATPTVLFDLNDENPCGNAVFSAPPPQLVRVGVQTQQQDGSTEASSRYGDRLIDLDLDLFAATHDLNATSIQKLGRLLSDPRGQWLKWQPVGATNPVFFRTKRADITSIVNLLATGARQLHLTIPAEPFAYGLPETGTATIANDPTAGTNPMSYVFPAVKGDVATPLSLLMTPASPSRGLSDCLVSTTAAPDAPTTPIYSTSFTQVGAVSGWALTTVSDSTAIGGSTKLLTKTSGTGTYSVKATFNSVPLGDYRVVARLATTTSSGITATAQRADLDASASTLPVDDVSGAWDYYDFGTFRLPVSQTNATPPGITPLGTTAVDLKLSFQIAGSTGAIRANTLTLLPAGLDDAQLATLFKARAPLFASLPLQVDAQADSVWVQDTNGYVYGVPIAGSLPKVMPNQRNVITLIPSSSRLYADFKTDSYPTAWLYYPRYLYIRPATT